MQKHVVPEASCVTGPPTPPKKEDRERRKRKREKKEKRRKPIQSSPIDRQMFLY